MTTTGVERTDDAGVATLTLSRPERHNAFDDTLIAALTAELEQLADDPAVRVVVLSGAGPSFSAGADLNWMRRMAGYSEADNLTDARALARLMATLDALPRPTIARVHGAALGGGVGLVACCDIALAAESAVFALSEVRLGLTPATISPYVVNCIGARQARRYFVTAERFNAAEALRIGLVHEVIADHLLDERLATLLSTLRGNGPQAMVAAKQLARDVSRGPIDAALIEETSRRIAAQRVSADGREGVAAFLGKRRPNWVS